MKNRRIILLLLCLFFLFGLSACKKHDNNSGEKTVITESNDTKKKTDKDKTDKKKDETPEIMDSGTMEQVFSQIEEDSTEPNMDTETKSEDNDSQQTTAEGTSSEETQKEPDNSDLKDEEENFKFSSDSSTQYGEILR